MRKIKLLTFFGTRPEVIKLAPFVKAVETDSECVSVVCATTQHSELQNDVLNTFNIKPDYDLNVMLEGQDLFHITKTILEKTKRILEVENPDYVIVQGDTTTAFSAALASFYKKIPVIHIEAGLRTGNLYSPFPEEANRSLISRIASIHMAPTQEAVSNLFKGGIVNNVFMVGNTIVDSVQWALENCLPINELIKDKVCSQEKKILITAHRRENFGNGLVNICAAVQELCVQYKEHTFIWPVHPNPNVSTVVNRELHGVENLHLIDPLSYSDMLLLINASSLILSDSGGIQEESCILNKRIIILREDTERPEVVKGGYGVLVGANKEKIYEHFHKWIQDDAKSVENNFFHEIYGKPGVSKYILSKIKESIT